MSIYVYEITKVYADVGKNPSNIKVGTILFEFSYIGETSIASYYDTKRKAFGRYYEEKFLFKLKHDIWTDIGKKEFQEEIERLKAKKPEIEPINQHLPENEEDMKRIKSVTDFEKRYFPKSEEEKREESMKDPKKAGKEIAKEITKKMKKIMEEK